jgi:hypothetical protein
MTEQDPWPGSSGVGGWSTVNGAGDVTEGDAGGSAMTPNMTAQMLSVTQGLGLVGECAMAAPNVGMAGQLVTHLLEVLQWGASREALPEGELRSVAACSTACMLLALCPSSHPDHVAVQTLSCCSLCIALWQSCWRNVVLGFLASALQRGTALVWGSCPRRDRAYCCITAVLDINRGRCICLNPPGCGICWRGRCQT